MNRLIKKAFKKAYQSFRYSLSANNSWLFKVYYRVFYHPKPNTLSQLLDDFSKMRRGNVTVIQIGANDGITHDPIHKFIKRDGWRGVLLEPQQDVFLVLKHIYHKNNNIITLNAALSLNDGVGTIYKIAFSDARWANGLTSFNKETILKAFESGYIQRNAAAEGVRVPNNLNECIAEVSVNLVSPSTLLERYKITHPDLLQIDTEGFDFEIIKMFNLKNIRPLLVVYESKHLSLSDKEACLNYLNENGYDFREYGANTAAYRRDCADWVH